MTGIASLCIRLMEPARLSNFLFPTKISPMLACSLVELHLTRLPRQTIHSTNTQPKGIKMTPEDLNTITTELKRFGTELNLSDAQKEQLKTFLTEKFEKLQEFRQQNPNASKDDLTRNLATIRSAGREKLEKFLTPDQLKKWDAEMAKAKDFLGQRAATA
jgi:periplasmic protein CpxP/Spy